MPLFYFHLRTPTALQRDADGLECDSLEAAYLEVCDTIPEQSADLMRRRCDPFKYAYVIGAPDGEILMEVPFTECLAAAERPEPHRRALASPAPGHPAERTVRLVAELRERIAAFQVQTAAAQEAVQRTRELLRRPGATEQRLA